MQVADFSAIQVALDNARLLAEQDEQLQQDLQELEDSGDWYLIGQIEGSPDQLAILPTEKLLTAIAAAEARLTPIRH